VVPAPPGPHIVFGESLLTHALVWLRFGTLPAGIREIAAAADPVTRTFVVKADIGRVAPGRVQLGQTTSGGTATFSNLPPGRYFVVAGRDIAPNAAITPDFVTALQARAISFEMIAGESKSVDVRPRPPGLACLPTHSGALLERCS